MLGLSLSAFQLPGLFADVSWKGELEFHVLSS